MVFNKKIACGLLLTAALCGAGTLASVGETQARYVNRATWYTVVEPTAISITGDSLAELTDPPLINLLGQLTQQGRELPITLTSEANLSGALTWTVDQPQYIHVKMRIGSTELASGDLIGLSKNKPTTLMMTVEPTEQGLSNEKETAVDIQLTWRETLTATYRVTLPVTEDTSGGQAGSQSAVQLRTVSSFHPETPIPLILTAQTDTQTQLSSASEPFPEGTRFSVDGGSSWYRLCQEGTIPVEMLANEPVSMLLDLSQTPLAEAPTLTVSTDGGSQATLTAVSAPVYNSSGSILTGNTPLEIPIPSAWQDCDLDYRVDMLMAGDSAKNYVPVELSQESLSVTHSQDDTGSKLIVTTGTTLPKPGTYRLYLQWSFNGLCFRQSEIVFFINYSQQTASQQTGGAQP